MVKRVEFHWKDKEFKTPEADGYKFVKNLIYGYLSKTIGEKSFNDLVFIANVEELKAILILDVKKEEKVKESE